MYVTASGIEPERFHTAKPGEDRPPCWHGGPSSPKWERRSLGALSAETKPCKRCYSIDPGALRAGYVMLRLPGAVSELFQLWLEQHFPDRKEKVLARIREVRSGRLNDPRFGTRLRGEGAFARQVRDLFRISARKLGLDREAPALSIEAFRVPGSVEQGELFSCPGSSSGLPGADER